MNAFPPTPHCQNATTLSRRGFLLHAAAVSIVPWLSHAAETRSRILDTHVHFWDPARPKGIAWPKPDGKLLCRRILPADYVAALSGAQVAADLEIARDWKPGSLKDDGKRGGTEKGFKK